MWGECEPRCEIYFSILQRKVLTPAVAGSLAPLAARILDFEATMQGAPRPSTGSSPAPTSTNAWPRSRTSDHSQHDPPRISAEVH
jgi:hypothetical protein